MPEPTHPPGSRYGRDQAEWDELEDAGLEFLLERVRLERVTSYTEMNTVLAQRTGHRQFDFDQESERAAMGQLLGRISDREFGRTGLLISAIVNYLGANDAGPGFYKLAQARGLIPRGLPRSQQWEFWAAHVGRVFTAYSALRRGPDLTLSARRDPAARTGRGTLSWAKSMACRYARAGTVHVVLS